MPSAQTAWRISRELLKNSCHSAQRPTMIEVMENAPFLTGQGLTSMHEKLFIDGQWRSPVFPAMLPVINPATEEKIADVAAGSREDVDLAVQRGARGLCDVAQDIRHSSAPATFARLRGHQGTRRRAGRALLHATTASRFFEARIDIGDAIATYEYYATLAETAG